LIRIRIAALSNLDAKTAYLDGELCGVDDAGLPIVSAPGVLDSFLVPLEHAWGVLQAFIRR
jgi:hypothetical protein